MLEKMHVSWQRAQRLQTPARHILATSGNARNLVEQLIIRSPTAFRGCSPSEYGMRMLNADNSGFLTSAFPPIVMKAGQNLTLEHYKT